MTRLGERTVARELIGDRDDSAVGAPILVGGNLWGVMMALSTVEMPLPDVAEARLAAFTELIPRRSRTRPPGAN